MPRRFRAWIRLYRLPLEFCVWLLVAVPIVAFYCWTATSSSGPFEWRNDKVDHYNLLADGFLSGHTYLKLSPPPEMLALPNPYDPNANALLRKHDASLYHERYYLYFGPVPALTLFVPAKLFFDTSPAENFAVVFYVTAGFAFSCLLLALLLRASAIRIPLSMLAVAFAGLGLAQFTPILLRRPAVYEIAIASGFCFLMAGLYFLARSVLIPRGAPLFALLAGICFGLAPGCRPHLAIPVVLLCLLAPRWKSLLLAPVAVSGALLAWYNYTRFGSVFEFGQSYQLTASVHTVGINLNIRTFVPALWEFLAFPPVRVAHFPYFRLRVGSFDEPTAGLAEVMPLCVAGLVAAGFILWRRRWMDPRVSITVTALLAAAFTTFGFLCWKGATNLRYQVDYTPELFVVALFCCLLISRRAASLWTRRGATLLVIAGCLWGAAAAVLLSISGYSNGLQLMNPEAFRELASWFGG